VYTQLKTSVDDNDMQDFDRVRGKARASLPRLLLIKGKKAAPKIRGCFDTIGLSLFEVAQRGSQSLVTSAATYQTNKSGPEKFEAALI
jgi:hypothetical protein